MPVAIDHVESEVVVEGAHGAEASQNAHRTLPEPQAVQRWRGVQRQVQWDRERTSAVDFEHDD